MTTNILENISLKPYNTFGINTKAKFFFNYSNSDDIKFLIKNSFLQNNNLLILGGGSNYLFTKDFEGIVLHPVNNNINITDEDENFIFIKVDAGIVWDDFVKFAVDNGYGGIENLSDIPGCVGAAPVQNIGAYGVEAKDSIYKVHLISLSDASKTDLINAECEFGYRTSIFKTKLKNKYIVDAVTFKLSKKPAFITHYGSINDELKKLNKGISIKTVRQAVINIRKSKLPDTKEYGSGGSFFKNPIVDNKFAANLLKQYPDMPVYNANNGKVKLAAGWLIDKCGLKGYINDTKTAGVHCKQALVIININNASGKDILDVSELVKAKVYEKFRIKLEPEVIII